MEEQQRTARPKHLEGVDAGHFTGERSQRRTRSAEDLHICPSCDSRLVHPVDWAPVGGHRWVVDLRCPECEWNGGGTYSQRVVDNYDEVLDEGTDAILADLETLSRANMEEAAERFMSAIWADQIVPEDF